jgi:hypothetical protein
MSPRIVSCFCLSVAFCSSLRVEASEVKPASPQKDSVPQSSLSPKTEPAAAAQPAGTSDLDTESASDIDDRFSTDGYAGVYFSLLQSSVPSLGLTGSIYLDDDLRAGIDFWRGRSKGFFSSFSTQGAGLWLTWELGDRFWMKGGLNYSRLERPTAKEPLAELFGSKAKVDPRPARTDSIEANMSVGQLWTFQKFTVSTDYLGFSLPFMTLTGPKQSSLNLLLMKADFLYNLE